MKGIVALAAACVAVGACAPAGDEPVRIILDTDIGSDVDDVGAVAVLHALADNGQARILGMMVCNSAEWGPPCLDAINTYYGRPDVPIGAWKSIVLPERSRYHQQIARTFPNDLKTARNAEDAVDLYQKLLKAQPDGSVVIVTTGKLNNLEVLLRADAELVARKVKRLCCMGGQYPKGREWNFSEPPAIAPCTAYVVRHWPTPILFSGLEIGIRIRTGARLLSEAPPDNPVRQAYKLYLGGEGRRHASWDQTAVLAAVRGPGPWWSVVSDGHNHVHPDGRNEWRPKGDGRKHSYLVRKMDPAKVAEIIEDLMVQPPAARQRPRRAADTGGQH